MKREYLDSIVFQLSLNKKPYEMFLKLLFEYFFDFNYSKEEFDNLDIANTIKNIKEKYGIILDGYSLNIWLKKEFILKDNKLILNEDKDLSIENIEKREIERRYKECEFLKKISIIIDRFIEYAKDKGVTISKEEAKDIFFKYNYINYIPYDDDIDENNMIESFQNKKNFIFYNFVKDIINSDKKEDLKVIEDCGIANQFSNMIFSKDIFNNEIFNKTIFYIDTPIILKYLGYAGNKIKESYRELFDSINKKNNKGKIAIFEHTIEEMQTVIYTIRLRIEQGFLNAPNVNEFLNARKENKNLPLENEDIIDSIKKAGIYIDKDTKYIDNNINDKDKVNDILIDEAKLKECMLEEYKVGKKNNKYLLDTRINTDIKSASFVSINRNRYQNFCFLLTTNNAFKKAVKKYHDDPDIKGEDYMNEILTENDIIFNLWQNKGDNFDYNLRTFFRLKCFSYLKIDAKFKEEFYIKSKRMYEQANRDKAKYINKILVQHPEYLNTAYLKKFYDNADTYETFKELLDSGIDEIKEEANIQHEIQMEQYKKRIIDNKFNKSVLVKFINFFNKKFQFKFLENLLNNIRRKIEDEIKSIEN